MQDNKSVAKGGKILTFFSTASASGKTTLAINAAAALVKRKQRVCLLDLDFQFNDVCRYLKTTPEQTIYDYFAAATDVANINEYMTSYQSNFMVLAAPQEIDEAYAISPLAVAKVLERLVQDYDYVIVDTTTGFTDITLVAIEKTDILFFLGIIDFIPTVKNMKIGLDTLKSLHYDPQKIKLVLNRNKAQTYISVKDVEDLMGMNFFASIPNDFSAMLNSVKIGSPLVMGSPNSALAVKIEDMVIRAVGANVAQTDTTLTNWFSNIWK